MSLQSLFFFFLLRRKFLRRSSNLDQALQVTVSPVRDRVVEQWQRQEVKCVYAFVVICISVGFQAGGICEQMLPMSPGVSHRLKELQCFWQRWTGRTRTVGVPSPTTSQPSTPTPWNSNVRLVRNGQGAPNLCTLTSTQTLVTTI